jgi:hypothetical protein
MWEAVDKAAGKAPQWVRDEVDRIFNGKHSKEM